MAGCRTLACRRTKRGINVHQHVQLNPICHQQPDAFHLYRWQPSVGGFGAFAIAFLDTGASGSAYPAS